MISFETKKNTVLSFRPLKQNWCVFDLCTWNWNSTWIQTHRCRDSCIENINQGWIEHLKFRTLAEVKSFKWNSSVSTLRYWPQMQILSILENRENLGRVEYICKNFNSCQILFILGAFVIVEHFKVFFNFGIKRAWKISFKNFKVKNRLIFNKLFWLKQNLLMMKLFLRNISVQKLLQKNFHCKLMSQLRRKWINYRGKSSLFFNHLRCFI